MRRENDRATEQETVIVPLFCTAQRVSALASPVAFESR
jgi:hypothetical protein